MSNLLHNILYLFRVLICDSKNFIFFSLFVLYTNETDLIRFNVTNKNVDHYLHSKLTIVTLGIRIFLLFPSVIFILRETNILTSNLEIIYSRSDRPKNNPVE